MTKFAKSSLPKRNDICVIQPWLHTHTHACHFNLLYNNSNNSYFFANSAKGQECLHGRCAVQPDILQNNTHCDFKLYSVTFIVKVGPIIVWPVPSFWTSTYFAMVLGYPIHWLFCFGSLLLPTFNYVF